MKKLSEHTGGPWVIVPMIIIAIFALILVVSNADTEFDFRKGVDMTGRSSITQSALNQLVDNAYLSTNKGLVIVQASTPDIVNNPRYTNFVWIDISGSPVLKFYNGIGWTNALTGAIITETNIANGSVTTPKLADGAVTSDKILAGAVGSLQIAGLAVTADKIGNDIINRNHIANDAIGTDEITNGAVTGPKIAAATITADKISTVDAASITNLGVILTNVNNSFAITNFAAGASDSNQVLFSVSPTQAAFQPLFYSTNSVTGLDGALNNTILTFGNFHNLGHVPCFVRMVFVFTNDTRGYLIGDEIDCYSITTTNAVGEFVMASLGADASIVYATIPTNLYYGGAHTLNTKDNGVRENVFGQNFSTNLYGTWKFYFR